MPVRAAEFRVNEDLKPAQRLVLEVGKLYGPFANGPYDHHPGLGRRSASPLFPTAYSLFPAP